MTNKALQWKKNRQVYENVEFPSGAYADLQRVDTMAMIAEDGKIPDTFYASMMTQDGTNTEKLSGADAKEFIKTMLYVTNKIAPLAFVVPKIVDNPNYDNDEISIEDLTQADKQFLWSWMMEGGEPAEALRRFLAKQAGSVATGQAMPAIREASIGNNGHNG